MYKIGMITNASPVYSLPVYCTGRSYTLFTFYVRVFAVIYECNFGTSASTFCDMEEDHANIFHWEVIEGKSPEPGPLAGIGGSGFYLITKPLEDTPMDSKAV